MRPAVDLTTDADVIARLARVSALPHVQLWLEAEDRPRRERALTALAVAWVVAWKPKEERPRLVWLHVTESYHGSRWEGRELCITGKGEDGGLAVSRAMLARVELVREAALVLYPEERVSVLWDK